MSNSQIADKVYEALQEKCDEFTHRGYDHWCIYLKKNKIQARDYDYATDAAEDLMNLANDGSDHIVCYDPFSEVKDLGGFQFLMIPKDFAEKIAVLGYLP
jgi:hypothetical protein